MKWNHRVLAHKDGDEMFFQIHEVYYDKKGKPNRLHCKWGERRG